MKRGQFNPLTVVQLLNKFFFYRHGGLKTVEQRKEKNVHLRKKSIILNKRENTSKVFCLLNW
jgi:hypothetical protein